MYMYMFRVTHSLPFGLDMEHITYGSYTHTYAYYT